MLMLEPLPADYVATGADILRICGPSFAQAAKRRDQQMAIAWKAGQQFYEDHWRSGGEYVPPLEHLTE
jgi:hypothetical protein